MDQAQGAVAPTPELSGDAFKSWFCCIASSQGLCFAAVQRRAFWALFASCCAQAAVTPGHRWYREMSPNVANDFSASIRDFFS